jgi:hypothetical protein
MTPEENKERLKKIREDFLISIDYMISEAETEARKKNATPTETQTKDEDFQDESEDE